MLGLRRKLANWSVVQLVKYVCFVEKWIRVEELVLELTLR